MKFNVDGSFLDGKIAYGGILRGGKESGSWDLWVGVVSTLIFILN